MNPFKDCFNGNSTIKVILKSSCFKSKKVTFNINLGEKDQDKFIDEVKNLIKKYEN